MSRSCHPGSDPWGAAPRERRRRSRERRALLAVMWLVALSGCQGGEREDRALGEGEAARQVERVGQYAFARGTLYRVEDDDLWPLAALPGGGPAADTLVDCVPAIPDFKAARFRRLTPAPDPRWTAWETVDAGGCVGVAGPVQPPVRTLGRWSDAVPDSVLWAPIGGYLAILLAHPGLRHSLEVFDGSTGARLEMPWEQDCERSVECDVARAAWVGGTLLNVEIRLGPAELAVPFEVNVTATDSTGRTEEI